MHTRRVLRPRRPRPRLHPPSLHLRLQPQQCSSNENVNGRERKSGVDAFSLGRT